MWLVQTINIILAVRCHGYISLLRITYNKKRAISKDSALFYCL
ncbi:hypothetical protein M917_2107 [Psychrobacter aquaticus CMS 56]|uniref:Uncharacterized protein n=1 Tax=Psychrobacter aquaticus CMS 56 TaxID=1354303 RepID=U4T3R9_9GAMM|nr:hypothetical protein M917_2107 [Psychrobacter aquaticus CMS 56]